MLVDSETLGNVFALQILRAQQDHPASIRQGARRFMPAHLRLQEISIRVAQNDEACLPANHQSTPALLTEAEQNEAYFGSRVTRLRPAAAASKRAEVTTAHFSLKLLPPTLSELVCMVSVVEELKGKLAELEARLEAIRAEALILEGQKSAFMTVLKVFDPSTMFEVRQQAKRRDRSTTRIPLVLPRDAKLPKRVADGFHPRDI
ncbi:hypothetical protein [Rhizobium sp. BK176]|uniref:hypothetical protein n=1 Tax=Rhizobium sp. BK176 TaxID=2587071 RepID=UPI002168FFCA|nr:hypothetical protein [Rhizobium sp. BK176]MCS4096724.1 hypothetical protein [Rhizobium sp. BK176]